MYNYSFYQSFSGHTQPVYQLIDFDENHFLSAAGDGIVAKWNINDGSSVAIAKSDAGIYALKRFGQYLAIGNNRGGFHCLDIEQGKMVYAVKLSTKAIFTIDYYQAENKLLVADSEGKLTILNAGNFLVEEVRRLSDKPLRTIAMNEQENLIAIGGSDHLIRVFSLPNWSLISTLRAHENSVFTCRFIGEHQLISGGRDARLRLFDVVEEKELKEIPAHLFTVNSIAQGEDFFVTASRDKSFKIWDGDWNVKKVFTKEKYPEQLKYSANTALIKSDFILIAGDDKLIQLWRRDN